MKHSLTYARILIISGLILLVIFIGLFILKTTDLKESWAIDAAIFGQFGDIIGGFIGSTLFALAGIYLLIETLNKQNSQFAQQKTDSETFFERQAIETRYFELLKIQRENSAEIKMKDDTGRKCFILIDREFNVIHETVLSINKKLSYGFESGELFNLAYLTLFYGIGDKSEEILRKKVDKKFLGSDGFIDQLSGSLIKNKKILREENFLNEASFQGHQWRLGHYFRHLYQTVNYINSLKPELVSFSKKYEYIKTLRAQLSTAEQALLFYNSLSDIGKPWEKGIESDVNKELITKYNLIKNIPDGYLKKVDYKKHYPFVHYEGEILPEGRNELTKKYI